MFRHIARSANSSVRLAISKFHAISSLIRIVNFRLGHGYQSIKPFGMLVPTEEFPMKFTVEPKPTSPAVIKQNILANGIKVITRDYNSAV